jgi:hypothetical protein
VISFVLALLLFLVLIAALTWLARGGSRLPRRSGDRFSLEALRAGIGDVLLRESLLVEREHHPRDGSQDLLVRDVRPLVPQGIFVRLLSRPAPAGLAELQGVRDRLAEPQFERAIVVSASGFTKEARSVAQGLPIQLLDGPALEALRSGPTAPPATPTTTPGVATWDKGEVPV